MDSAEITIHMNNSSIMKVKAEGRVYEDSYGFGSKWIDCEDFCCFNEKSEPIPEDTYDVEKAQDDFIKTITQTKRCGYD